MKKFIDFLDSGLAGKEYMNDVLSVERNEIIFKTRQDLEDYVGFIIKKTQPEFQENLEEAFYVCTWGARTMASQVNIFKGVCSSFVLMASRHMVKELIQYHPFDRFEDKLVHRMFRLKKYNDLGKFETSQIPLIRYNSNLYIKYLIWGLRSTLDQLLIKISMLIPCFKKRRLFKHIEWGSYYKIQSNRERLLALTKNGSLSRKPLELFMKRANGKAWPLSDIDITSFFLPIYLIKKQAEKFKNNT